MLNSADRPYEEETEAGRTVHRRGSYPGGPCPRVKDNENGDALPVIHECDETAGHLGKHKCGVCGLEFGGYLSGAV